MAFKGGLLATTVCLTLCWWWSSALVEGAPESAAAAAAAAADRGGREGPQEHLSLLLEEAARDPSFFVNGKINFVYTPQQGHHGVLRAPLKEKELLFAIPTSFLLTSELDHWVEQFTAAASDSTSNIHVPSPRSPAVSHFASLGDSDRLLLRLLEEYGRGRSSRWFHYIALLPDDVGNPFYFQERHFAALQGTVAMHVFEQVSNEFGSVHIPRLTKAIQYLSSSGPADLRAYWAGVGIDRLGWAYSIIKSRAFMVAHTTPPHRLGDHPFLAPVVDLLNHSPDAKMAWHLGSSPEGMPPQTRFGGDDTLHSTVETGHSAAGMVEMSGDAFRVFALEPPHGDANAVGREVFNHYDALPNHRLLVNYGFAIDNNPDDMIPLSFSFPLADPDSYHGQLQRQLLDAAGIVSLPHVIKFSAKDRKGQSLTAQHAEQHSSVSRFVVGEDDSGKGDQASGSEVPADLMNLARLATYSESDMRAVAERLAPVSGSTGNRNRGGLSHNGRSVQSLFLSPAMDDKAIGQAREWIERIARTMLPHADSNLSAAIDLAIHQGQNTIQDFRNAGAADLKALHAITARLGEHQIMSRVIRAVERGCKAE